jgi:hypothetical protein
LNKKEVWKIIVAKMNTFKSGKKTATNKVTCDDMKNKGRVVNENIAVCLKWSL